MTPGVIRRTAKATNTAILNTYCDALCWIFFLEWVKVVIVVLHPFFLSGVEQVECSFLEEHLSL